VEHQSHSKIIMKSLSITISIIFPLFLNMTDKPVKRFHKCVLSHNCRTHKQLLLINLIQNLIRIQNIFSDTTQRGGKRERKREREIKIKIKDVKSYNISRIYSYTFI